ncbi:hypothetical protein [Bosea sp. LC85]|uniref:hypothetical protein n=1 Tax=Bosea sp. LC85 TaxID=1502851 RepID=UPI00126998F7|nr:hypothetical protein [Bosea sp. LC85]
MITLTLAGPQIQVGTRRVTRIRHAVPNDGNPKAKTRVDGVEPMLVIELPEFVASTVKANSPTLAKLSLPDGNPVWFNAENASGPLRLVPSQKVSGALSALLISGKRQYVANTHDEVAEAIAAAGGSPLPIPVDSFLTTTLIFLRTLRGTASTEKDWD